MADTRKGSRWKRVLVGAVVLIVVGAALVLTLGHLAKGERPLVDEAMLDRVRPTPSEGSLRVTWTGVAGLIVEATKPAENGSIPRTETLLIDPYVTRHSWTELAWPLDVDEPTVTRAFPVANAILVGHSHHDHLFDAIAVAKRTGAVLYGSSTSCAIALGAGLAKEKCSVFKDGDVLSLGAFEVQVVEHEHGKSALGVPFPGTVEEPTGPEPFIWELKMGGAFAFVVQALGRRLYHQGSAGLTPTQLKRIAGIGPELAFVGIALRQGTPKFEERLLTTLLPMRVAAIHHDDFFGVRLTSDPRPLAGVDVPGFEQAVEQFVGPGALVKLRPFEPVDVPKGP